MERDVQPESAKLQTTAAQAHIYPKIEWQKAPAGDPDIKGQSHAGTVAAGTGACGRNYG
nr:hypothetical protein [Enterobacter asburiae]